MTSAFSDTLRSITTTKLREIAKQRQIYENNKSTTLATLDKNGDDLHQRLHSLVNGVKKAFALTNTSNKRGRNSFGGVASGLSDDDQEISYTLKNIEKFLEQARYDPTISGDLLTQWEKILLQKLDHRSSKFQYASLYGELVNDWLKLDSNVEEDTVMDVDAFEVVDKAEQQASRKQWEDAVFTPYETDQNAITEYLQELFGKASSGKALTTLRKSVKSFESDMCAANQFTREVLTWSINGLLNSGLLSEEKNQVLKDFLRNSVILDELADVLNMRIVSIESWNWEQEYVPVESRRHLNGNYHSKRHLDILI